MPIAKQFVFLAVVFFLTGILGAVMAKAQEKATPDDRAAIQKCLDAAKKSGAAAETCIGAVQKPCLDSPDGQSTLGMKICSGREMAAWDERLNRFYQALLRSGLGALQAQRGERKLTGADILRDAQRAWLNFRDKKCDAAGLPMEGGTGAGILVADCYMVETARQALWLEEMGSEGN